MLKNLKLHNFRTFLNVELAFTQRHLVIGRNNSGKSNLCAALRFLEATASGDLGAAVRAVPGGVPEIKNWAVASNTIELSCICEIHLDGIPHRFAYALKLSVEEAAGRSQEGQLTLGVEQEALTVDAPGFSNVTLLKNDGHEARMLHEENFARSLSTEDNIVTTLAARGATMLSKLWELETNRRAIAFRRYLRSWQYFALSPEAMRYGWRGAQSGDATLNPQGDNLAVVLFNLKNTDERRYRRVIEHVQIIEPDLEVVNFVPSADQAVTPSVGMRHCHNPASWRGLSDGTLRSLALAAISENVAGTSHRGACEAPPLTIIEEPENGIFPGQLRKLFEVLYEDRAANAQFLFTSHSPYFINLFDARRESVTLLRRGNERTEVVPVPLAMDDPDRPLLAEQYSMELFD